jgi:hypothetical protein
MYVLHNTDLFPSVPGQVKSTSLLGPAMRYFQFPARTLLLRGERKKEEEKGRRKRKKKKKKKKCR